jgi:hypothetical protein
MEIWVNLVLDLIRLMRSPGRGFIPGTSLSIPTGTKLMNRFEEMAEDGELSRDGKAGGGLETIYAGGMHNLAIDEAGKVCPVHLCSLGG